MAGNEDIPPPISSNYEPFPNGRPGYDPAVQDRLMEQHQQATDARNRWAIFKGHIAAVVTTVIGTCLVLLLAAGVVSSFMGDYKRERLETELRQEMTDRHNDTVIREGKIVAGLMSKLAKRDKKIKELEHAITELETDVGLAHPGPPPKVKPDTTQAPNMPAQQQLDWTEKYRETYKKK